MHILEVRLGLTIYSAAYLLFQAPNLLLQACFLSRVGVNRLILFLQLPNALWSWSSTCNLCFYESALVH